MMIDRPWIRAWFLVAFLLGCSRPLAAEEEAPAERLKARLDAIVRKHAPPKARVAAHLRSTVDDAVLYAQNDDQPFGPASNLKLLTTAAAAVALGPTFEWVTTLGVRGTCRPDGVLEGALVVVGSGDPTISGRFNKGNPTATFEGWADALAREGIRTIEGDLLLDDTVFDRQFYPESWEARHYMEWYAAETAGLSLNDNCIDLTLRPGRRVGDPIEILLNPPTAYVRIVNATKTVAGRRYDQITIRREAGGNEVRVGGTLGIEVAPGAHNVPIHDPVLYFGTVLKETLAKKGIVVRGEAKAMPAGGAPASSAVPNPPASPGPDSAPPSGREPALPPIQSPVTPPNPAPAPTPVRTVAEHRTPLPPSLLVINRRSQNYYAEQLLRTLGHRLRGKGTRLDGIAAVADALRPLDLPDPFVMEDGCGLARGNRVTARTLAVLLDRMLDQPEAIRTPFTESLAVPGEEGSLHRRFTEAAYRTRVRAKTGYISGVSALSGYLKTKRDQVIAFSILVNNVTDLSRARELQDAIVKAVIDQE
jgi:D-alanyl-D-alanine carboxypeptidase/D-alanyl-D-alanine-endopeptidase (penicillin-binding protein 4)